MSSNSVSLSLDGIRVVDLSRVIAGPFCGALLGDMGADVIKVEDTQVATRPAPGFPRKRVKLPPTSSTTAISAGLLST